MEELNTEKCIDLDSCIEWVIESQGGLEGFMDWTRLTEHDALILAHHGFGMWLRNTLELWFDGPPVKYFNEIGIYHADDMSGILLTSIHRKYHNQDINLDSQIKYYRDFWEKHNPNINKGILK